MLNTICYLIYNLFRVYIIRQFFRCFFREEEIKHNWETPAYLLFYAVNSILYLHFHIAWLNLGCNLLGTFLLLLLYSRKWHILLFVFVLFQAISIGGDVLAAGSYQAGQSAGIQAFVLEDLFLLVSVLLTQHLLKHGHDGQELPSIALILVPVSSFGIVWYVVKAVYFDHSSGEFVLEVICMGMLLINFLVLYLYNMLSTAMAEQYENKLLKEKVLGYAHQLDIKLQTEKRIRQMRHDMKHHLTQVYLLAKEGKDAEIQAYIGEMQEHLENPQEFVNSDNKELDSLLNYMLAKAESQGIHVESNVLLPSEIGHSFDINIIMGNLLENSIEASVNTEKPYLSVTIREKQGVLRIRIENNYSGKRKLEGMNLLTTKKDQANHGYGLRSVQEIVDKYHGEIEFRILSEDMVCVMVLLYLN